MEWIWLGTTGALELYNESTLPTQPGEGKCEPTTFNAYPTRFDSFPKSKATIATYPISQPLLELVKLRVSQMNGCAFCVSLHTQQLRLQGETHQRIDLVSVWEEAPCYTQGERVALRWAEALTRLADGAGVSEELYETIVRQFGEEGSIQLSLVVAMINTWNRLAVPFQTDHQYIKHLLKKPAAPAP